MRDLKLSNRNHAREREIKIKLFFKSKFEEQFLKELFSRY